MPSAPPTSSIAGSPTPPPMPDTLRAFWDGLRAGSRQVAQSVQSFSGPPTVEAERSPAAEPLGWSDLASPSGIAPKLAYQFAQSYPTAAGGVAGGVIGGRIGLLAGPEGAAAGALIGGGLGAAALSAAQTLGPVYAAELQKNPNDPEGAWNRAWRQAEITGAFSGAAWAAFPARFFQSPVKHLVFQIFGAQPALAVGQRFTSNIVDGRPATEGIGEAYGQGVVGSAIPALGHAAVRPFLPKRAPTTNDQRPAEPITPPYEEGSFSFNDWTGYPPNLAAPARARSFGQPAACAPTFWRKRELARQPSPRVGTPRLVGVQTGPPNGARPDCGRVPLDIDAAGGRPQRRGKPAV
jgi:hypothetical protein